MEDKEMGDFLERCTALFQQGSVNVYYGLAVVIGTCGHKDAMQAARWLLNLPAEEAQRMLDGHPGNNHKMLGRAFVWDKTPQGYGFWHSIHQHIREQKGA